MAYFKINNFDISHMVSELIVGRTANYSAQTNAAGNTVVDYINHKRTFSVGIIPIDNDAMTVLQSLINALSVSISYRDPINGKLVDNVLCIIPQQEVEYYSIRANGVLYKAFTLKFMEL